MATFKRRAATSESILAKPTKAIDLIEPILSIGLRAVYPIAAADPLIGGALSCCGRFPLQVFAANGCLAVLR